MSYSHDVYTVKGSFLSHDILYEVSTLVYNTDGHWEVQFFIYSNKYLKIHTNTL